MSRGDDIAFKYAKENGTLGQDYNQIYDAVKYGYQEAQLTWEELKRLDEIMSEVYKQTNYRKDEEYYTEVIRRFKEEKSL